MGLSRINATNETAGYFSYDNHITLSDRPLRVSASMPRTNPYAFFSPISQQELGRMPNGLVQREGFFDHLELYLQNVDLDANQKFVRTLNSGNTRQYSNRIRAYKRFSKDFYLTLSKQEQAAFTPLRRAYGIGKVDRKIVEDIFNIYQRLTTEMSPPPEENTWLSMIGQFMARLISFFGATVLSTNRASVQSNETGGS